MIEPLVAFFFLEGLLFDIIGAIIIVRGLYPIKFNQIEKIQDVNEIFKVEQYILTDLIMNKKEAIRQEHYEALEDISSLILRQQVNLENLGKLIPTIIRSIGNYEQHKYSLSNAIRGLPLLIGGFILQGIAVILQL